MVSDRPDMPENLVLFRRSDSCGRDDGCFVFIQLDPPRNIKQDDIHHYILNHQLGSAIITSTTFEFLIRNCTIDLDIEVHAVSRCGTMGTSVIERVPPLPADDGAIAREAMNQGTNGINRLSHGFKCILYCNYRSSFIQTCTLN